MFNNADLSKVIAALRDYGFFVDKSGVPRLSQLTPHHERDVGEGGWEEYAGPVR